MTRDIPNPLASIVNGAVKLVLFTFYAFTNGIQKLLTPSQWNFREQAKRDIPKIPMFTKAVAKNSTKRFTGFFEGRGRGNYGPRK